MEMQLSSHSVIYAACPVCRSHYTYADKLIHMCRICGSELAALDGRPSDEQVERDKDAFVQWHADRLVSAIAAADEPAARGMALALMREMGRTACMPDRFRIIRAMVAGAEEK